MIQNIRTSVPWIFLRKQSQVVLSFSCFLPSLSLTKYIICKDSNLIVKRIHKMRGDNYREEMREASPVQSNILFKFCGVYSQFWNPHLSVICEYWRSALITEISNLSIFIDSLLPIIVLLINWYFHNQNLLYIIYSEYTCAWYFFCFLITHA